MGSCFGTENIKVPHSMHYKFYCNLGRYRILMEYLWESQLIYCIDNFYIENEIRFPLPL